MEFYPVLVEKSNKSMPGVDFLGGVQGGVHAILKFSGTPLRKI